MAHANLQNRILRAMVDGQRHVDFRDGQIAHNPRTGDIQCTGIIRQFAGTIQHFRVGRKGCIVALRRSKEGRIVRIRHGSNAVLIVHHGSGLVGPVHRIADRGVQHDGKAHQEDQNQ